MREKLIQYVELLFAGAKNCEDTKQEILQNTLDRYDDLIADGKVPEAAYRLAIGGIGDISEILGTEAAPEAPVPSPAAEPSESDTPEKKKMRSLAVGLYILSAIPLFLLSEVGLDTVGLCCTLVLVAIATVLMIQNKKSGEDYEEKAPEETELQKSVGSLIWAVGLVAYFALSFHTGAWYITWLMFPIIGAVQGLAKAILDLMEVNKG